MDRRLHLLVGFGLANPDYLVPGLLSRVENSNHVAGNELDIQT
jgi:hypothetical protein